MDELPISEQSLGDAEFHLATVTAYSSMYGAKIRLDGQDTAMAKYYKTICGTVTVGKRVVVMKLSGTYIVLGMLDAGSSEGVEITTNSSDIFSGISSGFTVSSPVFARYGKLAMFTMIIKASAAGETTSWKTWATLKAGKRPCMIVLGNCQATNFCVISTDGQIMLSFKESADYNYRVSATYILP